MGRSVFSRAVVKAALLASAAATGACVDLIDPPVGDAPETVSGELTLGAVVTERIDHSRDIDEFIFRLRGGDEAIAFLQLTEPGATPLNAAIVEVLDQGSSIERQTFAAAASTDDFESTTAGVFRAVGSREYRVVIRPLFGTNRNPVGAYRLQVRLIDRRPERAAEVLAVGDTVSEAIDHLGDVDEFTLSGPPGEEYVIFVGAEGSAPHRVTATVGMDGSFVTSASPGTPLLGNLTRRFVIPVAGSVKVTVVDAGDKDGLYRGPYRIYVHRVDRRPEGRAAEITLQGGPIVGAIEVPGDIDEYILTTTAPATMNMFLTRRAEGATGGGIRVELLPVAGGTVIKAAGSGTAPGAIPVDVGISGRFTLPAGSYRLRVEGAGSGATGFRGSYELELYVVNPAPESIPAAIAIGDTVRGESIERSGDFDTFTFHGNPSDTLNVQLQPVPGGSLKQHSFTIRQRSTEAAGDPAAPEPWIWFGYRQSGRIQLPATGEYEVVVRTNGDSLDDRGPYQLILERVSARPEHRSAALAIGDTVSGEPLDFAGDIDDFVVQGVPGATFGTAFTGVQGGNMRLQIIDPGTREVLFAQTSHGFRQPVGPVTMPAGGEVLLRVGEVPFPCSYNPCTSLYSLTGNYTLLTYPLNRLPEVNPPAIAIGVTGDDTPALLSTGLTARYCFVREGYQ